MGRASATQSTVETRDLILEAAIARFSRSSYEAVELCDIGADVDVDLSHVHRCFGSKERLFAEAVGATISPYGVLADTPENLSSALAKTLFARNDTNARDAVGPLDILIRSLSSSGAAQVLRKSILDDFIDPLAGKLMEPADRRAALIVAFLAGIGIFRSILRLEPLLDAGRGELESLVARVIESIMDAEPLSGRQKDPAGERSSSRTPMRANHSGP